MPIKDCAEAFAAGCSYKGPYYHTDGTSYWLHSSRIAHKTGALNQTRTLELSYCGWLTSSTHNHLKHIALAFGKTLPYSYGKDNQPPIDTFLL